MRLTLSLMRRSPVFRMSLIVVPARREAVTEADIKRINNGALVDTAMEIDVKLMRLTDI